MEAPRTPGGLQIFYAASGETADTVIERLVRRYAESLDLLVATEDRAEQDVVVGAGAHWVGAAGLVALMRGAETQLEADLRALSGGRRSSPKA